MTTLSKNFKNSFIAEVFTLNNNGKAVINYAANSGGYESNIYFVTKDSGVLSVNTVLNEIENVDFNDADDAQWFITGYDVNYENNELYDDHTGELVPAAYDEE